MSELDPAPAAGADPLSKAYGSLNEVSPDLSVLHDLACRGSWLTILDKVIQARPHLSKPHHHLTYFSYNLLSLIKLRRFSDALNQLDSLDHSLDSPNYLYQTYPKHYPNQCGSMVPFILRVLHAELPAKVSGNSRQETLDRLYVLLEFVRGKLVSDILSSTSRALWEKRECFVINSIISHHLSLKQYGVCLDLIKYLIQKSESDGEGDDHKLDHRMGLLSKLGYIQMQYGDLDGAKATFGLIENQVDDRVELRNLVGRNKALIYLVGKDYVSAVREYDECIERDGNDVVAINNKALCLMYLRDLSDSIKVLESSLERIPTMALNETLVVNLCSMYELAYVNHADIKKTLSNWIARVAPDDFDSTCTRV